MSKKSQPLLLLLDGNALLHRAWHALPPLTTKDGRVVNAAYGFAMVLEKMLEQFHPTHMVAAWDLPGKTFRHEKFEAYKAQREEKAPELYAQIPLIQEILAAHGVPSVSLPGFEADDVIGTLATRAEKDGMKTLIVTGDMDALQLVSPDVHVVAFKKGISETMTYDGPAVKERYGLTPDQLIDYKALRGDPSDNIPGVRGIGEKSATELIQTFGGVEVILKALKAGKLPEKYAKKFSGQEDTARQARELVEIVRDAPIPFKLKEAAIGVADEAKIVSLYRDLDFRTLLRKRAGTVEAPPMEKSGETERSEPSESSKGTKKAGGLIRGTDALEKALKAFDHETVAVLCVEQSADLFGSTLSAIAVSDGVHTAVVPNPSKDQLALVLDLLASVSTIVAHDAKQLMKTIGWEMDSRWADLMIASYLLHSGSRAHDIPSIANAESKFKLDELPAAFATDKEFATIGAHVSAMPVLWKSMSEKLEATGMMKVFRNIEMPLIPILRDMESVGIELDVKALESLSKKMALEITRLERKLVELAGEEFNVNSPSQLATILFEKLQLPTKGIKKTQTGFSTAATELEKLMDTHEIIPLIGEYRELAKLQSTYVEALPKLVGKDGRVHTTYNQTVAATGRLSSTDPNLQNIPIKTDLGNEIRKAFVAAPGKKLIAIDYSQIELRLVAVIAKDQAFIEAFKEGADIHTRTAAQAYGIEEKDVTSAQRRAAKAINFGIIYGMGARSLARATDMSFAEAQDFIDRYFQIHSAVRTYLDETKALAHKQGYVETLFGRRRYFPEIQTHVPMLVAMAERMAINMPVQGTAADIMKLAMISVHGWLSHSEWPAKMLLQVHDELVIECDAGAVSAVVKGVKELMESVASFDVPLTVEVEVGDNWGEMSAEK